MTRKSKSDIRNAGPADINVSFLKELDQKGNGPAGLFPLVFAMNPSMMAVTTADGQYLEVNQAFCEATGYTRDELLGKISLELGEWKEEQRREILDQLSRDGKIRNKEIYWRNKSREVHCCLLSAEVFELDGERLVLSTLQDITKRKRMEDELRKSKDSLALQAEKLEALNTALKVLLDQQEQNQRLTSARLKSNMQELITPYLERLKDGQMAPMDRVSLSVLESNLMEISSDFVYNLASCYPNLTPKEIQVANLVKEGKSSGEISHVMGVSLGTVNAHRNNLRRQMRLGKGGANLRSHLLAMK
ncbi:MAG: PAS domain S-box protein [Smithellaceae bacterium]|nr:PAS domain S-box protein [Smithellaceae bacterium]